MLLWIFPILSQDCASTVSVARRTNIWFRAIEKKGQIIAGLPARHSCSLILIGKLLDLNFRIILLICMYAKQKIRLTKVTLVRLRSRIASVATNTFF